MARAVGDVRFWLEFMLAGCVFATVAGVVWAADVFRQIRNKGE